MFWKRKAESVPSPCDNSSLDYPLFFLSKEWSWRVKDACEGTHIFGATGSGKTSGSGRLIAKSFLKAGYGGLVLTAKVDETSLWRQYCQECGREESLIVFSPENQWRFNFLNYELNRSGRGGGLTKNIVNLFLNVLNASGKGKNSNKDSFWENALRQLLSNAVDLLRIARGKVDLSDIELIINSAPQNLDQVASLDWRNGSACYNMLLHINENNLNGDDRRDIHRTAGYFLNEFPSLAEKTRSVVVTSFTSLADILLRGPLYNLFCTETNFLPELTHEGAVVVFDMPVKEYSEVGRLGQIILKLIWQQSIERRDLSASPLPAFLWADEAQHFLVPTDSDFQATARSSRAMTVYLSQNLPTYYEVESPHAVDSLLGNLRTKVFHNNDEQKTNLWAAELISKAEVYKMSYTSGEKIAISLGPVTEWIVQPGDFLRLRKGGSHPFIVEGIFFQGGRLFPNGSVKTDISFSQRG